MSFLLHAQLVGLLILLRVEFPSAQRKRFTILPWQLPANHEQFIESVKESREFGNLAMRIRLEELVDR